MENHYASLCHFLLKLCQSLTYLGIDPDAVNKKKANFQGRYSYAQNRDYVRTLQDAGLIPYTDASEDNFVDVVDNDQELYTPQLLNEEEE